MELEQKRQQLLAYMNQCAETDVALAFSGGVDSSLLLKIASDCAEQKGTRVIAVTFQTRLHPPCDMEAAVQTAREMGGGRTGDGGDPPESGKPLLSVQKESVQAAESVC